MSEHKPRALTLAERRWIHRLQRVLLDCPPGLSLMTIGDAQLSVIDRVRESEDLGWGAAQEAGIELASIRSGCKIHGVSDG